MLVTVINKLSPNSTIVFTNASSVTDVSTNKVVTQDDVTYTFAAASYKLITVNDDA